MNLAKIVAETATIITIANALKPGSAEIDPRSSDFGKIKVGDSRFDITGGAGSLVTLGARLATNTRKSTATGEIIPYGSKFGQSNRLDAIVDFAAGKTTPSARIMVDWMRGRNYKGDPFKLSSSIYGATTPIILQQAIALKDDTSADRVAGVIADGLGISSYSYEPRKKKSRKIKLRGNLSINRNR